MGKAQGKSSWTPPTTHDPRSAVAAGRRLRHQTQAQLAEALTRRTDENWSEQMVGKLERGLKEFTIETLMAIAAIQQLPYSWYLEGPSAFDTRAKGALVSIGALTNPPVLAAA